MEEESCKMHSEDDKAILEKNKKRTVKTHAQVQALEKFYNEHKYPTETMKIQLAESIGLTEKQVSGWFCHRRLKDKRLMNGDNHVIGRQDRSSVIIQDHGSGQRQDSCGSTKQGDGRNFDAREVESGRLTLQECSAVELTYDRDGPYSGNYNRMDNASSGSSSSLRNMSNHRNGDPFDVVTSRYLVPKFPADVSAVKTRPGPSGYLKVKGQVENTAITAVKRQLGKHYRDDGPPLAVDFDPLPPGAFESSMQNPVDETYCTGEDVLPVSPDFSKVNQRPKFGKGSESMASHNKMLQESDNHIPQKFKQTTSLSNSGAYYQPWRNSSVEMPRDMSGSEGRDDCRMRYRQASEVTRMNSVSSRRLVQPVGVNSRSELEPSFHKSNDVCRKSYKGVVIENGSSPNLTMRGSEYQNSNPRQIAKDGQAYYAERIINENQAKIPYKNDTTGPKRMRDGIYQQPRLKQSSVVDNRPATYQVIRSAAEMPSNYSEDEGSAETSSSLE